MFQSNFNYEIDNKAGFGPWAVICQLLVKRLILSEGGADFKLILVISKQISLVYQAG